MTKHRDHTYELSHFPESTKDREEGSLTNSPKQSRGRTKFPLRNLPSTLSFRRLRCWAGHRVHPHPYLGVALPEWTVQQLVAHILGFGPQPASPYVGLRASRGVLTAWGCLCRIRTPGLGTIGVKPGRG